MKILKYFLILISTSHFAQEKFEFTAIDSLYREDQIYVGISYNTLQNKPSGSISGRFTPSFSFGVIRDMPINKSRTWAIAAGFGYAINNYNQNIQIAENNNSYSYSIIKNSFDKNKLVLNYIEIPIEFRWRNSTPETHQFWRVYAGFKASYLVYNYSKYVDRIQTKVVQSNPDLNNLLFGTYLSFGYNTINFNVFYGLNPIYKAAKIDNNSIDMRSLNFGFMFYIL